VPAERSTPLEYTADLGTLAHAASTLQRQLGLTGRMERQHQVTFLDTFDWALSRAGLRLTQSAEMLELTAQPAGTVVLRGAGDGVHRLADGLPAPLREKLSGVLGLRALLPVAVVRMTEVVLVARNADEKTVARLVVARPSLIGPGDDGLRKRRPRLLRLTIVPLRGYSKEARRLGAELSRLPGVAPAQTSLFTEAVTATGRRVEDYSSKMTLSIRRDQTAYEAARQIYGFQLGTMSANAGGVISDLDTEFLHDFRVAVRRTRSALKELPGILPPKAEKWYRREFKWLGDVTTPTRDLDVYLLTFPEFTESVGGAADVLEPLRQLLIRERRRAQRELARQLRSARYRRLSERWEGWLAADPPGSLGPSAATPIGELADARIRRVGRRVLRTGAAITDDSPAEALHGLRKRCKELRYLLEFFGSLYDSSTAGNLVTALKGLQDNLGEFQDSAVQHAAVDGFAETLLADGDTPTATLLALGRLGGTLEQRQQRARAEFARRFADFGSPANRRLLDTMTGPRHDDRRHEDRLIKTDS
jgi:CHAD domain-containing protein